MSVWEYIFVFQLVIISRSDEQVQKQLIRLNLLFIFIQYWLSESLSQKKIHLPLYQSCGHQSS